MKFCIITHNIGRNDGQGRVNFEIAAEALRQGHEVVLLAEKVSGLPGDARQTSILLKPPAWLPTRILRDQLFALRSIVALSRVRATCDAVLANGFVTWARCDINAVHFVHASWVRSLNHRWQLKRDARSLYAWLYSGLNIGLERSAFRRAGQLVAVSRSVAADLQSPRMPKRPIRVILNGVDTVEFYPAPTDRQTLGLPHAVPLALFAGDLKSPRKNLDTVLRALPLVPDLHLAVAGRATGTPYPALAAALGVSERVHFLGFRRDMPAVMRAADIFVFPSRYEACTLVLLEALASGIPVVTARCTGGSELIDPDVGIVLEDCDDIEALASALQLLVTDKTLRQAMGRRARTLAEHHSWPIMARRYIDLMAQTAKVQETAVHV